MILHWEAPEYEYVHKTADWYWAVWIIAISVIVTAILFDNYFLALFVIIAAITLTVLSTKKPHIVDHEINQHGIRVGTRIFHYEALECFWIDESIHGSLKLLVKSKKAFMPLIIIPLGKTDPHSVAITLDNYLPEGELHESLYQKLMEYLGF